MQRKFYTISLLDPKLKWERYGVSYSKITPSKYNPLEIMEHKYERFYPKRLLKVKADYELLLPCLLNGPLVGILASLFIFQNKFWTVESLFYTLLGLAAGLIIYFYELEKNYCYEIARSERLIKGFRAGFSIIKEKDWSGFLTKLHALTNPKKAA